MSTRTVQTRQTSLEDSVALSTSMGPAAALIRAREADDATVAAIRAEVRQDFAGYATADGASIPASIHVVTARNPGG